MGKYKLLIWNLRPARSRKSGSSTCSHTRVLNRTITAPPSAVEKVVAFVDERVGLKNIPAKMLNEPVPGGSRWAYVFGSVLLFIFIMQAVTGIL